MRRTMTSIVGVSGWVALILVLGMPVAAAQPAEVSAPDGWIQLPASGSTTADAFVVVKNPTMYDVYLVSATSDAAETIEFYSTEKDIAKELTVPAYGSIGMSAEGVHLRLTGLTRALAADEHVTLTIETDGGITMTVSAIVRTE